MAIFQDDVYAHGETSICIVHFLGNNLILITEMKD